MEDLPGFPMPPMPIRKRRKRYSLLKAIWDSCFTFTPAPLGEYFCKEWRAVKRYPGILFLTVCAAAFVTWYGVHWWYFEVPYNGETNLKVFFPGDGAAPQTLSKSNIYYSFVMTVDAQMDTPRDEKSINTTTAKFWQVNITFDKEVKADANLLASGLSSDFMLEIRNFNPRSAFVTIVPAKMTPDKPVVYPRGMLEIKVEPRLSNSK